MSRAECTVGDVILHACDVPADGRAGQDQDGALTWSATTIVLVEAHGGGHTGIGYTYGDVSVAAMYANDASDFRQVPVGVVLPRTLDAVVATHRICSQSRAPILNRGGGTSLSGETVNHAVVIDHSKHLTAAGEIDRRSASSGIQRGCPPWERRSAVVASPTLSLGLRPGGSRVDAPQ
jgi:FAD binding domain